MPYNILLLSSWGFGLYSEKPFSTSRVVGRQMAKTLFKLFILYSYVILGMGGGEVAKIIKRSEGGGWTNSAFANSVCVCVCVGGGGVHDIIISPLKLISQPSSWQLLHSPLMTSNFLHLSLSTLHSGIYFITRELIPSSSLIKIKRAPPLPLNKPLSLLSFTSKVFEVNNHTVGEGGVNRGFTVYVKETT